MSTTGINQFQKKGEHLLDALPWISGFSAELKGLEPLTFWWRHIEAHLSVCEQYDAVEVMSAKYRRMCS